MRVKIDENLPVELVAVLAGLGHDADTVEQEGLKGRDDADVWKAAQVERRFLITQDLDFSDVRRFQPGTHAGILVVRLKSPGLRSLLDRVSSVFQSEDVATWPGCFVVATETKVRIRRAGARPA